MAVNIQTHKTSSLFFFSCICVCVFVCVVLGIGLRTLHILDKCASTKLYSQPVFKFYFFI